MCLGMNGDTVAKGQLSVSTSNRNFEGRQGIGSRTILASPLTGNRHDAEDLLQDTFARLWRKRDQFRGDGSLEGYVRRISYRVFLNARSRLSRGRFFLIADSPLV